MKKRRTKPWEHRRWRGGLCRSGLGVKTMAFWGMTVLAGGLVAILAAMKPEIFFFAKVRWAILGSYALAGACLIFGWKALIYTARWVRFGRCMVQMQTCPGVIGGQFRGEAWLPESMPLTSTVAIELVCESTTILNGTNRNSDHLSVDCVWSEAIQVPVGSCRHREHRCIVPFDFSIPPDLPDETDSRQRGNTQVDFDWTLRVSAPLDGPDLNLSYRVPVFRVV